MELRTEIKANCTNCNYVAYIHTDGIRYERCKIRKKYNTVSINPMALQSIEEWDDSKGPIDLCERYSKTDKLATKVYY
ncbi:MAG: hypothetical protein WC781_04420 [Candidatus Pacearchaeota archaeon]|jgi:hypothetical protein